METKKKPAWLRMIAVVVLTLSISCFGISIAASLVYGELGKNMQQDVQEEIDAEYCKYIASALVNGDDVNTIKNFIRDFTNLEVAVIETEPTENGDAVDTSQIDYDTASYVLGDINIAKGSNYHFSSPKNVSYNYNVHDIYGALTNNNSSWIIDDNNGYMYEATWENDEQGGPQIDRACYHIFLKYDLNRLDKDDLYMDMYRDLYHFKNFCEDVALPLEIISAILAIICVIYIIYSLNDLTFWDKIPYGIYLLLMFCLIGGGCAAFAGVVTSFSSLKTVLCICLWLIFFIVFFGVVTIESTIARIKAKKFWRYTVCYYVWRVCTYPFKKIKEYFTSDRDLFKKLLVAGIVLSVLFLASVLIAAAMAVDFYSEGPIFLWALVALIILWLVVFFVAYQFKTLYEGTARIREGGIDEPIPLDKLKGLFKKHAENINTLGEGIDAAVQERIRSERFKTELITNVSHDIKTPLTSIINYVDLIKKEDVKDETMLEYVDVLDRQSARLKKLIEDLMEASKASTGNVEVNLEECDVSVILGQAIGEFEDKMTAKELIPIVTYPENPINIKADGRHLWRVFDNLLNNICKYALPGTRVYINVVESEEGSSVDVVFKNISSTQLNISSDELMERFVRGDSSRNTEGSGLGLSIAKSLTELMNGELLLDVDGDLFKATLRFTKM